MKKNFFILAICAVVALGFSACTDEPTATENLTTSKGWTLTSATCDPAYELSIGAPITNLFQGFILPCEVDDILYFNINGGQLLNPGKDGQTADANYECAAATEVSLGNWTLTNEDKTLKFFLPYYKGFLLEATILTLNETTLTISVPISENDGEDPAKTIRNYTFTLSYTRN